MTAIFKSEAMDQDIQAARSLEADAEFWKKRYFSLHDAVREMMYMRIDLQMEKHTYKEKLRKEVMHEAKRDAEIRQLRLKQKRNKVFN